MGYAWQSITDKYMGGADATSKGNSPWRSITDKHVLSPPPATPAVTVTPTAPAEPAGAIGKAGQFVGYTAEKIGQSAVDYTKGLGQGIKNISVGTGGNVYDSIMEQQEGVYYDPNSEFYLPPELRNNSEYMQALKEQMDKATARQSERFVEDNTRYAAAQQAAHGKIEEKYPDLGDTARKWGGRIGGLGQIAAQTTLGLLAPGAAVMMAGASAAGNTTAREIAAGTDLDKAVKYGALSGAVGAGVGALSGVNIPGVKNIPGVTSGALDDVIGGLVGRLPIGETAARVLSGAVGEYGEEALEEIIDPLLKRFTQVDPNATVNLNDIHDAGMGGFVPALLFGAGGHAANRALTGGKKAPATADAASSEMTNQNNETPIQPPPSPPVSEKTFPQIDTDYQAAIDQYGAIPPGRQPRQNVEVPRSVDSGDVSYTARTTMEVLPESDRVSLMVDILNGNHNKETTTNAELLGNVEINAVKDAMDTIDRLSALLEDGRPLSDAQTAELDTAGRMVMGSSDPDVNAALNRYARARTTAGSAAGKSLQAQNLAKMLTPIGRLGEFIGEVERINEKLADKIIIPQELTDAYQSDQTTLAEADSLISKHLQPVADQIPVTFMDKINTFRYLSMLANPRTHIRNLTSNTLFGGVRRAKNVVKSGIENVLGIDKTTVGWKSTDADAKKFATEQFNTHVKDLMAGGKYNPTSELMQARTIFTGNNPVSKLLNFLSDTNGKWLEAADQMAIREAYVDTYAQYMEAAGYDTIAGDPAKMQAAHDYAAMEALRATFRDPSKAATILNEASKSHPAAHLLIEGIIPFKKTPINIVKRGAEYSPLGFIKAFDQFQRLGKADRATGATLTMNHVADSLATSFTGTGIMALGYGLASMGGLVGWEDKDARKKNFDREGGTRAFSLKLPNGTFTIDWAAPAAMPLFMGVSLHNTISRKLAAGEELSWEDAMGALMSVSDPLLEMSFMQSLQSALQSYSSGSGQIMDIVSAGIESYLGQFVPSAMGAVSRTVDPTQYDSSDTTALKRVARRQLAKASPVINAIDPYYLVPAIDSRGNERDYGESFLGRLVNNLISPGLYSKNTHSPIEEALGDLSEMLGDTKLLPRKPPKSLTYNTATYTLTPSERETYARTYGARYTKTLTEIYSSPAFNALDANAQSDALSQMYKYLEEEAKATVVEGRGESFERSAFFKGAKDAETVGIPLSVYFMYRAAESSFTTDKDRNGKTIAGSKKAKVERYLKGLGLNRQQYNALMASANYT